MRRVQHPFPHSPGKLTMIALSALSRGSWLGSSERRSNATGYRVLRSSVALCKSMLSSKDTSRWRRCRWGNGGGSCCCCWLTEGEEEGKQTETGTDDYGAKYEESGERERGDVFSKHYERNRAEAGAIHFAVQVEYIVDGQKSFYAFGHLQLITVSG